MPLRFTFSDVAKGFVDTVIKEIKRPIASKAATAAIRETAAQTAATQLTSES
jgi:hypothetical protein